MSVRLLSPSPGITVQGHATAALPDWTVVSAEPGAPEPGPDDAIRARVPGTVAGALTAAGRSVEGIDDRDWWYRCRATFPPSPEGVETALRFDGLATNAEVWLGERRLLESKSMFLPVVVVPAGRLDDAGDLGLVFRALGPVLARRHPRPRWKASIVTEQALRWHRTQLLGRCPGFAPGPPVIGPWRPVVVEQRTGVAVDAARLRPTLREGTTPHLHVQLVVRGLDTTVESVEGHVGGRAFRLHLERRGATSVIARGSFSGHLDLWWPHTHGSPALHPVGFHVATTSGDVAIDAGDVGFRAIEVVDAERFALSVNGLRLFSRGGALLPDPLTADLAGDALERLLRRGVEAGMNMLRLPGLGAFASDALLSRCDELGVMVWQDFPFANMDYPVDDPEFRDLVEREALAFLEPAGRHPSLAVLCGGSEIEQQASMLGVDATFPLLDDTLPASVVASATTVPFVRSTPTGGDLPFLPNVGVSHYFGVGAYRRPLEDARRADVRFAAECLAFANVPEHADESDLGSPVWNAGTPRDHGVSWDFGDVRDHYLAVLFGVDPSVVRSEAPKRYLELSAVVTGEVMAATLGEWRRARSTCSGALLWTLNDLHPGPGWGVLDHAGMPKPAYWYVRRALAPIAVWLTDEGTNGIALHLANDTAVPVEGELQLTLVRRDGSQPDTATMPVLVAPHEIVETTVEHVLGRFADVGHAYRFGPATYSAVAADLETVDGTVSSATFCVGSVPSELVELGELGLRVTVERLRAGSVRLRASSRRLAHSVRIDAPGHTLSDNYVALHPGRARSVDVTGSTDRGLASEIHVRPLNASESLTVALSEVA